MHRLGDYVVGLKHIFYVVLTLTALTSCYDYKTISREITPADYAQTLNHESPYLKAHMHDGSVYILHAWSVDSLDHMVKGSGELFNFNREPVKEGNFAINIDSVSVFETNMLHQSGSIVALSVITGVSVAITTACIVKPKGLFWFLPDFLCDRRTSNGFAGGRILLQYSPQS